LYTSSLAEAPAGSPTSPISWKAAQASWVEQSVALAGVLNSALAHAGIPVIAGRTALPALDSMACPAVALEMAPLAAADHEQGNSPADAEYQARVAEALAAAVVEWRAEERKQ
jgi:N-acetylmuramoyl-L-alanine amidase